MFWRRVRRVGGPRRWWPSPLRRAGGPSGRQPRSSPIGIPAKSGRSATCVRPPAPRRASRLWPRPCRRGSGSGGPSRQGPKGRLRMTVRVTAGPYGRMGSRSVPPGWCSSGPAAPSRPRPTRSAMHRPVPRSARWSGSAASGGRSNTVWRKGKRSSGWRTMQGGKMPAGSTIWCSRCWRIFSCGTCRGVWEKKAPALTVSQLRR